MSHTEGLCFTKQGFHILIYGLLLLFSSHVVNGHCPALFLLHLSGSFRSKCRVTLSCYQILIKQGTEGLLGKVKLKVWERKSKSISLKYFITVLLFFNMHIYVCVYTHAYI